MWGTRRGRRRRLWAGIFADDLVAGCHELLSVYGASDSLTLPITIPIDPGGVVLLRPEGPLDAPRVPATLVVERQPDVAYVVRIARRDDGPMIIPGMTDQEGDAVALASLSFAITPAGMDIAGHGLDGRPVVLAFDEPTARALATALLITIRMKLIKARRD
ncbi:MAG: hypothetical protein M3144_11120 [Actinomycetota bacterium]|nr:hypothetical protein [Actinomycetota bacterium]